VAGSRGIWAERKRRLPTLTAGEYGPIAGAAVGDVMGCFTNRREAAMQL
jgi:hypothetical protein